MSPEDVKSIMKLCKSKKVVLVSDCGTPGFCDPGADLVDLCRKQSIRLFVVPGASSLMAFLSLCGVRLDRFYFRGFLPAKTELRILELKKLKNNRDAIILMDTPYRLNKLLSDIEAYMGDRECVLGTKLTFENEEVFYGKAKDIQKIMGKKKAEFILLIKGQILLTKRTNILELIP